MQIELVADDLRQLEHTTKAMVDLLNIEGFNYKLTLNGKNSRLFSIQEEFSTMNCLNNIEVPENVQVNLVL